MGGYPYIGSGNVDGSATAENQSMCVHWSCPAAAVLNFYSASPVSYVINSQKLGKMPCVGGGLKKSWHSPLQTVLSCGHSSHCYRARRDLRGLLEGKNVSLELEHRPDLPPLPHNAYYTELGDT